MEALNASKCERDERSRLELELGKLVVGVRVAKAQTRAADTHCGAMRSALSTSLRALQRVTSGYRPVQGQKVKRVLRIKKVYKSI
jgi:hypothetical protein